MQHRQQHTQQRTRSTMSLSGQCPPMTHFDWAKQTCVLNPPAPNPSVTCGYGSVYSSAVGGCVQLLNPAACPLGTVYDRVTGTCRSLLPPPSANPCDWTSPFQCTPAQWVRYQDVSEGQFLAPGPSGIAWGSAGLRGKSGLNGFYF